MAKAKLELREDYYLILRVYDDGHVSIQEYVNQLPRAPTVMTGQQARRLAKWLADHTDVLSTYDPVIEKAKERARRYKQPRGKA